MTIYNRNIRDVAKYIGLSLTTKGLSVSPLKLQKILYYTQAWFMAMLGRENTVFNDIPEAWVNGPVYPVIYYDYRDKAANMCDHLESTVFYDGDPLEGLEVYTRVLDLDTESLELIESIVTLYGAQTQNKLIWLTHSEQPWAEARAGLRPGERSERKLSLDLMCDYYHARYEHNHRQHEN